MTQLLAIINLLKDLFDSKLQKDFIPIELLEKSLVMIKKRVITLG